MDKKYLIDLGVDKKMADEILASHDSDIEAVKADVSKNSKADKQDTKQKDNVKIDELKNAYQDEIKNLKLKFAVEKALLDAKAKNIKAVTALLELEKAEFVGDKVSGLDDQIEKLKQDEKSKFMFDSSEKARLTIKGTKPYEGKASHDYSLSDLQLAQKAYKDNPSLDNMTKLSRARIEANLKG